MIVLLYGASGMVGQGVLRECLLAPDVTQVIAVVRAPLTEKHDKLRVVVASDMGDLSAIESDIAKIDACFFCLGVSAAGMSEADYRKITYDLTLTVAKQLVAANPAMSFSYVSGAGTGGSGMWARVKAEVEKDLLGLGFRHAYMFRPGLIQPRHGIQSRTAWYRAAYVVLFPVMPVLHGVGLSTTTEELGLVMLQVARTGSDKPTLENRDIVKAAKGLH